MSGADVAAGAEKTDGDSEVTLVLSVMVEPSSTTVSRSPVSGCFLRLTTLFFRFLLECDLSLCPPKVDVVAVELRLCRDCRDVKALSKVYTDPMLPEYEWARDKAGVDVAEREPDGVISRRSRGPVHARKTASLILGVNKLNVRCESVNVANLSKFFLEKRLWVSRWESSAKAATSAGLRLVPVASTGS